MPHSVSKSNGMAPQVNGDAPSSAFLSHLYSYPLISDSISTFKSNPYGQKSIDLTQASYDRFAAPFLPYFSKPYQYVSPYVKKADTLGDHTLKTIDERFPVVKKPTGELYSDGKSLVFLPLKIGNEGKDYVFGTYSKQVEKTKKEGLVGYPLAVVGTGIIVGQDALAWVNEFLAGKKQQAKEVKDEKVSN